MPTINKQVNKITPRKKGDSVIDRIGSGWADSEFLRILLYGQSGSGKTTLWATFPHPILAIICSGSKRPGEMKSINTPEYRKKIKPTVIRDSSECKALIEYAADSEFQTVVLDHVSGLQDFTLREILGLEELPAQKSWGLAKQDQWGQSTMQCKEILRAMLGLDKNVVIIGQERESEPKEDSELQSPSVGVATTPSLAGWLNPACDYICQTFKRAKMVERKNVVAGKTIVTRERGKGVEYCLRTAPHDIITTKFRIPKGVELPEIIVDPTYAKIMNLINQGG